ncbi:MAG: hypothetical protein LBT39_08195, partial [Treponema sp.]|nr:hypothetical protein [Treponema sp.]
MLKGQGGVLFCLLLFFCGNSCGTSYGDTQTGEDGAFAAYYLGLKALAAAEDAEVSPDVKADSSADSFDEAYRLFETALKSQNPYITAAAAEQLIPPLLRGEVSGWDKSPDKPPDLPLRPLHAAVLYQAGRYDEITPGADGAGDLLAQWDRIIPLVAQVADVAGKAPSAFPDGLREEILGFLFDTAPGAPLRWAAQEIRRVAPDLLSNAENAVLEGRFAVARSSFGAGLTLFRLALLDQPELFLQYPSLITDLGRSFQFTASGTEGIDLFLEWAGTVAPPVHYRLLYFAGRIARARGAHKRSGELFTQALDFVPDELQADACIWYIMDTALQDAAGPAAIALVKTWLPRWHDPAYFDDIMDRVSRSLASTGQWQRFPELLALLDAAGSRVSRARYAYISGRAVAEGLIPLGGPDAGAGLPVDAS